MGVQLQRMTVEEFEQYAARPENADRRFEFIGGEVVEMVSNQRSSEIATNVVFFIKLYLHEKGLGGIVTGADGGYTIVGERYIPDVAYISQARQAKASDQAYGPTAPDLAVEVLSPSNEADDMRIKVVNFLRAGTTVWVVNPEKQYVEVYVPGEAPQRLGMDDVLDGGVALPGFTLAVKDVFGE